MSECKYCKYYKDDCGHHYIDENNHIHYDASHQTGACEYYEDSRSIRKIVISKLSFYYKDAHADYYLGKAIDVLNNMSDESFDKLMKEKEGDEKRIKRARSPKKTKKTDYPDYPFDPNVIEMGQL